MAKYLGCTEVATHIRITLKKAFPMTRFWVRSNKYAGGASIHIQWSQGPSAKDVDKVVDRFQGADFDAMQDLKIRRPPITLDDGCQVLSGADYIFCRKR